MKTNRPARGWLAAFLNYVAPGMGYLYCGQVRRGILTWIGFFALVTAFLFGVLPHLSFRPQMPWLFLLLSISSGLALAGDAWRCSKRTGGDTFRPRGWLCLLLLPLWFATLKPLRWWMHSSLWPLGRSYFIPSESMAPTLQVGDYLLTWPTRSPQHNDIVVFTPPSSYSGQREMLIKRVVGLPGDRLAIANGQLHVNGQPVEEPFLAEAMNGDWAEVKVPAGQYFLMGDNRNHSYDCRYWGSVPLENIREEALWIVWSSQSERIGQKL